MTTSSRSYHVRAHWWMQRVSAFLLLPLLIYGGIHMHLLWGSSIAMLQEHLAQPWSIIIVGSITICCVGHSVLGLQVIVEDYMPRRLHALGIKYVRVWGMTLCGLVGWGLISILFHQGIL